MGSDRRTCVCSGMTAARTGVSVLASKAHLPPAEINISVQARLSFFKQPIEWSTNPTHDAFNRKRLQLFACAGRKASLHFCRRQLHTACQQDQLDIAVRQSGQDVRRRETRVAGGNQVSNATN